MVYIDEIWSDETQIVNLVNSDFEFLQKKTRKLLKYLFKSSTSNEIVEGNIADNEDTKNSFDQDSCLNNLETFYDCVAKITKHEECHQFVNYLFDLIYGHSKIRDILLEKTYRQTKLRCKVVELFCLICSTRIDHCKDADNLVDLILSAYDATFVTEDQHLLRLLSILESSGYNLQRYRPFIWGHNGAVFYASKHAQKLAFLKNPTIDEIFNGFDGKCLYHSLSSFPIDVQMTDSPTEIINFTDSDPSSIYDPRFLLPMFYHFLSAESIVKCHKFILHGALSYTVASLSSNCSRIRAIAYRILARFYYHLECATYPQDRHLWIGLIDYLRSGLSEPDQRIESIHTVFFVRAIEILHKPLSPLFPLIRQFLLNNQLKPYNFSSLPEIYNICIHQVATTNMKFYPVYQKFIIHWITYSMRSTNDVLLCHRKNVFSDMLLFYNSPLCPTENKPLILKLLINVAKLVKGVEMLCCDCAIFSWIKHQLLMGSDINEETTNESLYKFVTTIWNTAFTDFAANREQNDDDNSPTEIFYRSFSFELIDVLSRIISKTTERRQVDKFVQICSLALDNSHEELYKTNIKLHICSNLPVNLGTMLQQRA